MCIISINIYEIYIPFIYINIYMKWILLISNINLMTEKILLVISNRKLKNSIEYLITIFTIYNTFIN